MTNPSTESLNPLNLSEFAATAEQTQDNIDYLKKALPILKDQITEVEEEIKRLETEYVQALEQAQELSSGARNSLTDPIVHLDDYKDHLLLINDAIDQAYNIQQNLVNLKSLLRASFTAESRVETYLAVAKNIEQKGKVLPFERPRSKDSDS